jgi:hypothetical protein
MSSKNGLKLGIRIHLLTCLWTSIEWVIVSYSYGPVNDVCLTTYFDFSSYFLSHDPLI